MSKSNKEMIEFVRGMSQEELKQLGLFIKARWGQIQQRDAQCFSFGDKVWFDAKGHRHHGEVVKVNTKTLKIKVGHVTWNCSPNLVHLDEMATA